MGNFLSTRRDIEDCEYNRQSHGVSFLPSSKTERKNNRLTHIVIVLLVIIILGLNVLTLIITLNRNSNQGIGSMKSSEEMSDCVPCCNIQQGVRNSTEMSKLYDSLEQHTDEDGVLQCCATTVEQKKALTKMVLKILSKKLSTTSPSESNGKSLLASPKAEGLRGTLESSLAYAQKSLQIEKPHFSKIPDTSFVTLEIDPEHISGRYELAKGVNLTKHGIVVTQPGFYFVYKSFNFCPDSGKPCNALERQSFESVLMRQTGEDTSSLIRSVHTCCPNGVRESKTGFTGGVFQLNEGDIIQVKVTGVGIIHIGRDVTYLGLMMMRGRKD